VVPQLRLQVPVDVYRQFRMLAVGKGLDSAETLAYLLREVANG
jgi:hypothetical protein